MHVCRQGRPSPPETMMHFPPCFRFPPYSEKFSDFLQIFTILPFPEKFLDFHPPKFLMTFFLVIDHKFRISTYFPCFNNTFPPCFAKIILSPYFYKFSPYFRQIHLLFTYFTCIPPYFDHDTFMHHPMHVLDAPGPQIF